MGAVSVASVAWLKVTLAPLARVTGVAMLATVPTSEPLLTSVAPVRLFVAAVRVSVPGPSLTKVAVTWSAMVVGAVT